MTRRSTRTTAAAKKLAATSKQRSSRAVAAKKSVPITTERKESALGKCRSTNPHEVSEGEDEEEDHVFVQLKKARDKTLHRAMVDKQTGKIKFKPKGRKTWVDYDVQKHAIIRLNKEVSDEEDQDVMDPAESEEESEEEKYMEKEKPKQRARVKSNKKSTSSKKSAGTKRKASSAKRTSPVKSRSRPTTYKDCSSTEDESDDDSDDEKSASETQEANNPKTVYASTSRVIDTFKDSDFGGSDWRTQGVIDY